MSCIRRPRSRALHQVRNALLQARVEPIAIAYAAGIISDMRHRKRARLFVIVLLCALWQQTQAHAQGYGGHRSIIARTLGDLHRASRFARGGRERERIENATRHLRELDRDLRRGRYDRGRLDEAVDDVHNVERNNNLPPRERDVLNDDLRQLRELRARERR